MCLDIVCWFVGVWVCWFIALWVCWFVGLLVCLFMGFLFLGILEQTQLLTAFGIIGSPEKD